MRYLNGSSNGPDKTDSRIDLRRSGNPPVEIPYAFGAGPGTQDNSEIGEVLKYLRVLFSNKFKILIAACLGASIGIIFSVKQIPIYQAQVSVELQAKGESLLKDQKLTYYDTMADIETQIKLLKSRSLIKRVRNKLDPSLRSQADSISSKSQTAGESGKNETVSDVLDSSAYVTPPQLSFWGVVRDLVTGFFTPSVPIPPRNRAFGMAAASINVRTPPKAARILEITCDSTDPNIAARFANALVEEYIRQNMEKRWETYQQTGALLNLAQEEMKKKLGESEVRLQEYARSNGLIFTGETNNIAEEKLRELQAELSRAQADRTSKEAQYRLTVSSAPESLPEVLVSSRFREYQSRLADLRRQLADLTTTLTPSHYKVARVQAQIDELERGLREERENVVKRIRNDYQAALDRERMMAQSFQIQTGIVTGQTEKAIEYNVIKREAETNRKLYEATLQKGKETSLDSALNSSNVRVVDPARPPIFPHRPQILLNLLIGLLGGAFLCAGFLLLREFLNRSFRSPGETVAYLNVPELGVIPSLASDSRFSLSSVREKWLSLRARTEVGGGPSAETAELTSWQSKPSLLADSFRSTLASILFADQQGRKPKVLIVTSAVPGEGKTTVLSNLGLVIAETGQRVLLIDGDMRKPRLNKIYCRTNTWGLSDLLRERTSIEDYPMETLCRSTDMTGLFLLPSGSPADDISPLIHSSRIEQLIDRLREEFDMVLIDTPPMIQISDSRLLSRLADGVILVIRSGKTSQGATQAALQRLIEDGAQVIGTVLNDWDPKDSRGSHHYDYKYDYQYKTG